jgi:sialic acid synthase
MQEHAMQGNAGTCVELTPGRWVGPGQPCYIVAEVGQNHNGDVPTALRLIDGAADAGADAVKFCKRDIDSDLAREFSQRPYLGPNSFGRSYGEHRRRLELDCSTHALLRDHAAGRGLTYFATACDRTSVQQLESLGVPCYKVASRDLTNLPLLEQIARTGKPVILSCGMDEMPEIARAVQTVRRFHDRLILLHCTSAYPTDYADVNLRAMATLRDALRVRVGLSDHSLGTAVPVAAVALGAVLVEKHITLDRRMKGTDHACSLELAELQQMVRDIRAVEAALGDGVKRVPPSVEPARARLRRSLVAACRIPRGTPLTEAMLCLKTAGEGLPWHERHRLLGRAARYDIAPDQRLQPTDVE